MRISRTSGRQGGHYSDNKLDTKPGSLWLCVVVGWSLLLLLLLLFCLLLLGFGLVCVFVFVLVFVAVGVFGSVLWSSVSVCVCVLVFAPVLSSSLSSASFSRVPVFISVSRAVVFQSPSASSPSRFISSLAAFACLAALICGISSVPRLLHRIWSSHLHLYVRVGLCIQVVVCAYVCAYLHVRLHIGMRTCVHV